MSESIWNDPRITAYAFGELSGVERANFEQELARNPELAAAVDETRTLTERLQTHYQHESTPPLDSDRREAILVRSLADTKEKIGPVSRRPWFALAVAGAVVFVMVGLIYPATQAVREAARVEEISATVEEEEYFELPASSEFTELRSTSQMSVLSKEASTSKQEPALGDPLLGDVSLAEVEFDREMGRRAIVDSKPQPTAVEDMRQLNEGYGLSAEEPASSAPLRRNRSLSTEDAGGYDAKTGDYAMSGGIGGGVDALAPGGATTAEPVAKKDSIRGLGTQTMPSEETTDQNALVKNRERMSRSITMESRILAEPIDEFGIVPRAKASAVGNAPAPFGDAIDEGRGPGIPGDQFEPITDNAFQRVSEHPLSTFSVDVDTASYSKVRDFLVRANQLPRPDAVRIEELVNYFDYDYAPPAADSEHPFVARAEIVSCPWNNSHRLARIAIKGKTLTTSERPPCNLVFLLDTSGSMDAPNKLPLVQEGFKMLLSQLNASDRVAIVVYAGSAGLVLESTPAGKDKKIRRALTQLTAGGSTDGGSGLSLAYQTAREQFIKDGVNRVILCTDGDFNVGTTGTDALVRMVEQEAKSGVFLTVLGFGMGNHNDAMLEQISGKGNGNYAFIDTKNEAHKVLVEQTNSTLVTIAKDVKLQIEFNPTLVAAYRLIGYENRVLAKEDFNDDKKDAGEIGAGHAVTALYEIVPAGEEVDSIAPAVDELKYQKKLTTTVAADSDETLTVKLRYKAPDADTSKLVEFPVTDSDKSFTDADQDVRFATAVVGFGMKLRRSEYAGTWTLADVEKVAQDAKGEDNFGLRAEFIELVKKAASLSGQERE